VTEGVETEWLTVRWRERGDRGREKEMEIEDQ